MPMSSTTLSGHQFVFPQLWKRMDMFGMMRATKHHFWWGEPAFLYYVYINTVYIHKQLCIITSFVHTFHTGKPWNIYRWSYSHFWMILPMKKSHHQAMFTSYSQKQKWKPIINRRFGNGFNPTYLWSFKVIFWMVYWVYHFNPIYGWYMTKW